MQNTCLEAEQVKKVRIKQYLVKVRSFELGLIIKNRQEWTTTCFKNTSNHGGATTPCTLLISKLALKMPTLYWDCALLLFRLNLQRRCVPTTQLTLSSRISVKLAKMKAASLRWIECSHLTSLTDRYRCLSSTPTSYTV